MRGEIVAIDLETTGLDAYNDSIIEIGLVRFRDGAVLETYETLIDPQRDIPPSVTYLTGIRPEDVAGKPHIHQVIREVERFIGNAPVLGHNVGFDIGFLRGQDILYDNVQLDTYELASVLLPTAPRYNLSSLAQQMQIPREEAHRALSDALTTVRLYWALWQKMLELPLPILEEITAAARGLPGWEAGPVFEEALAERARTGFGEKRRRAAFAPEAAFTPAEEAWPPLRAEREQTRLNLPALTGLLEQNGLLARMLPGYEHRTEQIQMLQAVAEAFNQGEHLMVEAGTGTGKSMAYLIPAIFWALQNGERVVISTNTINLQDQLMSKDIPLLRDTLNLDFKAAVMKGRSNYLCPRRLATMHRRQPTTLDELRIYAKVLIWLLDSQTGDRSEINLRGAAEIGAWTRLSAEDDACTLDRCQAEMHSICPFYKARLAAENAHILIVNHALLLSDVATGNHVLPKYNYLILDEAHHLEEATTNGLSFETDQVALRRQLAELGGRRTGILGDLLNHARGAISETYLAQLEEYVENVEEAVQAMDFHINGLFSAILQFLDGARMLPSSNYVNQVRITMQLRDRPGFETIQIAWNNLSQFTIGISSAMSRLALALGRLEDFDIPEYDDIVSNVATAARNMEAVHKQLEAFANKPDANTIYWVEVGQDRRRMSIHSAPLHVGPLIDQYLWQSKEVVILTSATLQTAGSFDYIEDRLQAQGVRTLDVGSPFNYRESTLLYVPTDMPDPDEQRRYQEAIVEALIRLAVATGGRLLGLFTSYTHLRQTAQAIAPRLALGNIVVLDQSDGTSRQALLDGFRSTEKAVLLGTRSFWEGVDIPGDDLVALAITRLPFAVPTDPIFAARSETLENSFAQYAVPDAILRFRQGFGRLIRTKTDRGVIVILDHRVISKGYGHYFLDSLPECTVVRKPLEQMEAEVKKWLTYER